MKAAVHLPLDGQCDPANIAMALAKGARQNGATIVEGVKVTSVLKKDGRITGVTCEQNGESFTIETENVVNCAGMWGRELAPAIRRHRGRCTPASTSISHRGDT